MRSGFLCAAIILVLPNLRLEQSGISTHKLWQEEICLLQTTGMMMTTEPKTKSVGVVKIEKLTKIAAFKDYSKAAADAATARKAQTEAKSKLKDYLTTKLNVEEKATLTQQLPMVD